MQEEAFLLDGLFFGLGVDGAGSVKWVGYERRDGAENECGEVEDAGGEDFGVARRES